MSKISTMLLERMNREATLAHTGAESGKKFLIHFRQWKCRNCQKKNFPFPYFSNGIAEIATIFFSPSPISAMDCHN